MIRVDGMTIKAALNIKQLTPKYPPFSTCTAARICPWSAARAVDHRPGKAGNSSFIIIFNRLSSNERNFHSPNFFRSFREAEKTFDREA